MAHQQFRSASIFPILASCLCLLPQTSAQNALSLQLSATAVIQSEPNKVYQVMKSSDMQNWVPYGTWMVGDGEPRTVSTPVNGEAVYLGVESSTLANLNANLESLRASTQVPALAAAVIQNGVLTGAGAVGQRRFGTDAPVTIRDLWHHGSLTKSMTATLAGMLVEAGLIDWSTTLGEVFPGKAGSMAANWSGVTLKQLLANSSGAPGDLSADGIWNTLSFFNGLPEDGRLLLLDEVTSRPLRFSPGTGYEYSNAGFSLAGLMLETVAGKPWEALMQERLFPAFGMSTGGTGVPATPRHLDHPVGHSGNAANPRIWDPSASADNPPAIGPSATVHASLFDMARYAQGHLRGARGESPSPLSPATWNMLHTRAFGFNYALGWSVFNRGWAGGDAITHTGSNTQWFTVIWIAPEVNWACVVCMNFGGSDAFTKADQVVGWLINNYGP